MSTKAVKATKATKSKKAAKPEVAVAQTAPVEATNIDHTTSVFGSDPAAPVEVEVDNTPETIEAVATVTREELEAPVLVADDSIVGAVAEVLAKRTVEKNRETRNGVTRPSAGGLCRAVWDYCDEVYETGFVPAAKDVKAEALVRGWNANNASIELYQWRKFMGIRGRAKVTVSDQKAVTPEMSMPG